MQPVQVATEVLNEAQNAVAGMRRVLGVLDTPTDVADPGEDGEDLPAGAVSVRFEDVSFAYPGGPEVLHAVDLEIAPRTRVAVVGETGSGKTTLAKLLTRLMDPTRGRVLLSGVPLDRLRFGSLRSRVVMVPQDGFLFDATVADNVRYGRPGLSDDDVELAFTELGLADWLAVAAQGAATPVGERGASLSVGERQLVAVARAYVADPDLLVLDEATSAVDPATEVRLQRALDSLTRGRTSIAIAHRLSTAEAADEVVVVDQRAGGAARPARGPRARGRPVRRAARLVDVPVPVSVPVPRAARACCSRSSVFGGFWGAWAAVLPDVRERAGLGDGGLGLALGAVAVAALPAMPLAGRLVDAQGDGCSCRWLLAAFAVCAALLGLGRRAGAARARAGAARRRHRCARRRAQRRNGGVGAGRGRPADGGRARLLLGRRARWRGAHRARPRRRRRARRRCSPSPGSASSSSRCCSRAYRRRRRRRPGRCPRAAGSPPCSSGWAR